MEEASCKLNNIKKGIIRTAELYDSGEITQADELKEALKKKLLKRASRLKKVATPVLEFISAEKYQFDERMLRIMQTKDVLPKS